MGAALRELIEQSAYRFRDSPRDYDPIVHLAGGASVVLLGGATHGTAEFYQHRAEITKRLITECGFSAVAVEADWPDAYRVHRFVQQSGSDLHADEALGDFTRFPTWMWRNQETEQFVGWLYRHNSSMPPPERVGFYGLDLYSLYASMASVLMYLQAVAPAEAAAVALHYSRFPGFGGGQRSFGYAALAEIPSQHRTHALEALIRLQRSRYEYTCEHGLVAQDAHFCAEQNSRVVVNAEEYYRTMFQESNQSWNLRERHMFQTLLELMGHLEASRKRAAKIVVWAHNLHSGDARAIRRAQVGEVSLGQLARESFGAAARLIGFTTSTGTVTAARFWNGEPGMQALQMPLPGSIEEALSATDIEEFFLPFPAHHPLTELLSQEHTERVIGIIYDSETERTHNYLNAKVAHQFDAVLHTDYSHAVKPREPGARATKELPETFPSGV